MDNKIIRFEDIKKKNNENEGEKPITQFNGGMPRFDKDGNLTFSNTKIKPRNDGYIISPEYDERMAGMLDRINDPIHRNINYDTLKFIKDLINSPKYSNPKKAEMIRTRLCSDEFGFEKVGTGTNRVVVRKSGVVFKIALDIYGVIDNKVEYFCSTYEKWRHEQGMSSLYKNLPKVVSAHDTGMVIASEYWMVMEYADFVSSRKKILELVDRVADRYIFDDIGYNDNNYMNFGFDIDDTLGIIDYGYLKPNFNIDWTCPDCKLGILSYDEDFVNLVCNNDICGYEVRPIKIFKQIEEDSKFDDDSFSEWDSLTDKEKSELSLEEMIEREYEVEKIYEYYVTNIRI